MHQLAQCIDKMVFTDVFSQADYVCLPLGDNNNYIIG